jgi:hypothetical protein
LCLAASFNAYGALSGRDLDGNAATTEAWFDDRLGISWLANPFQFTGSEAAIRSDIAAFSIGAASDWRLPINTPVDGGVVLNFFFSNSGSTDRGGAAQGIGWGLSSELGHLYYVTLNNAGYCTPDAASPDSCVLNPAFSAASLNAGPFGSWFAPGESSSYCAVDLVGANSGSGFAFAPSTGVFGGVEGPIGRYGWAVHAGDVGKLAVAVTAVPEPGTYALMLAGLGVVGFMGRQRRQPKRG